MAARKRYAQVGTGGRASFFYEAVAGDYRETSELVAFCDMNSTRMALANRTIERLGAKPVPTFTPDRFDEMVRTTKPDTVIVTSIDRTHHRYIIRAMELGCDVISEKPMTVDEAKCQEIVDAIARTGRRLRVTFNYRYSPHATKIRELIRDGAIGTVNQVHFEWVLDTSHGADYFRRWHRDKRNSGGLLVHKATHHFDLVNFWIGSRPKTVFAFGDLMFYGRENAERRGVTRFYSRVHGSPQAEGDPFALHLERHEGLKALYLDAEKDDGYLRDQSVFGDGISIEDTMAVLVRYASGAMMSYSLVAYSPWEGFRVCFTGTKGRLEVEIVESSYVSAAGQKSMEGAARERRITLRPMFELPRDVEIPAAEGGHGGGDPVLLNDLFGRPVPDPFNRAASHVDGAWSILTGIAANKSIRTGLPVDVDSLVKL
ncbi:MAG: Gfo/Idh/MocA family oxidoreductase [Spirochaetes bacterium]|nr:Gfo/Idh/MocA family oxidoreductase [Spirochaetota bacterium]